MASMDTALDAELMTSVNLLSEELQLIGVDNDIQTTSLDVTCQSLLRTAWNLVQFIYCESVGSSETVFSEERERKLRDELQRVQTQVQRCKSSLEDKENEVKSRELLIRQLRLDLKKYQNERDELLLRVRNLEIQLKNSKEFHKKEIFAQVAECDQLRDHLRSKIGLARTLSAQTESFSKDLERLSVSKPKHTQEDKLREAQQAILTLTENNQTLVAENLWMRDTFGRLYKQLNDIRLQGLAILENVNRGEASLQPDKMEDLNGVFNQPLSVAIEKLRNLGQAQVDAIMHILRLFTNYISST